MPAAPQKKKSVSVIERRLKSGQVFTAGSRNIPLVEPSRWTLRIANSQVRDGHLHDLIGDKGWEFADKADLAVDPIEVGFRELDGRLVRGDKGQEVLLKMAKKDYQAVVTMKDQENRKNTFSDKAIKQTIINAASKDLGDQGASTLDGALKSVHVTDSRERVSLED